MNCPTGKRLDSTPLFVAQSSQGIYSSGTSYLGRIRARSNEEIAVIVNYNMDGKKAEILLPSEEYYPRPIFVSAD